MTTREKIIAAAREAGFDDRQWESMTYDSGPYEVTTPKIALERFYTTAFDAGQKSLDQQLAVSMAQNLLMRDLLGTFRDDVLFQIGTESPYRKNIVAPYYERVKDVLSATVALGDCIVCKAEPVAIVNEDDDNKWADILPDRDIRYNTFLYVAVDRPKT